MRLFAFHGQIESAICIASHQCLSIQCRLRRMQNSPWFVDRVISFIQLGWLTRSDSSRSSGLLPVRCHNQTGVIVVLCSLSAEEGKLRQRWAPPGSAQHRAGPVAAKLGCPGFPRWICTLLFSAALRAIWVLRLPA